MSKTREPFRFKQFAVHHDRSMKVGTDAVLLGAWVDISKAKTMLDVGTGSGIIALMLAQRSLSGATVDAIEIDRPSFLQAGENFMASPWSDRLSVFLESAQGFYPGKKYDHVVSNPPFFQDSLLPPSRERAQARHTGSLSYADLLTSVKRLLTAKGKFSIILPTAEGEDLKAIAAGLELFCSRSHAVFSRKKKPQERWLLEFRKEMVKATSGAIVLHEHGSEWSGDYKALTKDFYLAL